DIQRAALKRQVRDVANGARNFAIGLRRRMNAMGSRQGGIGDGGQAVPVEDLDASAGHDAAAQEGLPDRGESVAEPGPVAVAATADVSDPD
ncbi:MAG: DUF1845 domain-containing protein, partial [Pseudomonadota bacterium]